MALHMNTLGTESLDGGTDRREIIAYRYGLLDPIDWQEDCREHLWLQNRMWNALVECERHHREKYRALLDGHADVAPLVAQLAQLRAEQATVREDRKRLRAAARAKVKTPELDAKLKELAQRIQPVAAQIGAARAAIKGELAEPIAALSKERFDAAKKVRQTSGLYWGNYNAVMASYEVGRRKAMQDGGELRFRAFRGEGRFTCQLIGGTDTESLLSGNCSQVRVAVTPLPVPGHHPKLCKDGLTRGGRGQPRMALTIYTKDSEAGKSRRMLTFPLVYDRPLPSGKDIRIQRVVITRRRIGTKWEHHAVFMVRIPSKVVVHPHAERRCAINLGFRERPFEPNEKELKHKHLAKPLRIAMLWDGARHREIVLPCMLTGRLDHAETIRSERDQRFNAVVASLRAAWPTRPGEPPQPLHHQAVERVDSESRLAPRPPVCHRLGLLLRAPKFAPPRLAALVIEWRRETPSWWPEMLAELEAWRRHDKIQYDIEAHTRRKALLWRRELYRKTAREIAREYGQVSLGAIDLAFLARLEHPNGEETELHQRARRNRGRAALYEFQQELAQQSKKFGTTLELVRAPYSQFCPECGQSIQVGVDLLARCPQGHVWDQDHAASRNILAALREPSSDAQSPCEFSRPERERLTRRSAPSRRTGATEASTMLARRCATG